MASTNKLFDDLQDQLIPKTEPVDIDFIKTEEFEEEWFLAPENNESCKVEKNSVKEEILPDEDIENHQNSVGKDEKTQIEKLDLIEGDNYLVNVSYTIIFFVSNLSILRF